MRRELGYGARTPHITILRSIITIANNTEYEVQNKDKNIK